jgi:hypothetical protein
MNITPLRAVRLTSLLLVAACVLASPAVASESYQASPSAVVESSSSNVSEVECPCNQGLPKASVASPSSATACPCNTGLPDGPAGALPTQLRRGMATARAAGVSTVSEVQCPCNDGLPVGRVADVAATSAGASAARQAGVAHAAANQSSRTFDWADAGVGAAVTAGIGLVILGGASLYGRRRVHGRLPAS